MSAELDLGPRLSARLSYLLKRALVELDALHELHLAPLGINARELTVLLFLAGREPESQQQAARHLGVDRTTMVGLLDALEGKQLVARRPDREDRRRNVIELTDAGRKMLRRATRASDKAEQQLLAEFDEPDAARLRELLARIAARPYNGPMGSSANVNA
jgi:DNA-binding MarR family transcriptional regulator